jgi:hypothetical protein
MSTARFVTVVWSRLSAWEVYCDIQAPIVPAGWRICEIGISGNLNEPETISLAEPESLPPSSRERRRGVRFVGYGFVRSLATRMAWDLAKIPNEADR